MSSHELDSIMLYIHPPLAIIGYVFIFLFTAGILIGRFQKKKLIGWFGSTAWRFTFLGLASGMLWAQTAWGSYWSWDPKETSTLLLFVSVTLSLVFNFEGKTRLAKWAALAACVLVVVTLALSYVAVGLHTFGLPCAVGHLIFFFMVPYAFCAVAVTYTVALWARTVRSLRHNKIVQSKTI